MFTKDKNESNKDCNNVKYTQWFVIFLNDSLNF